MAGTLVLLRYLLSAAPSSPIINYIYRQSTIQCHKIKPAKLFFVKFDHHIEASMVKSKVKKNIVEAKLRLLGFL